MHVLCIFKSHCKVVPTEHRDTIVEALYSSILFLSRRLGILRHVQPTQQGSKRSCMQSCLIVCVCVCVFTLTPRTLTLTYKQENFVIIYNNLVNDTTTPTQVDDDGYETEDCQSEKKKKKNK